MASAKLILRTDKRNSKGECPLFVRIIKFRKTTFISLKLYIKEQDWDKSSQTVKSTYRNSARYNALIATRFAKVQQTLADAETKKKNISARQLKDQVVGSEPVDFFEFSRNYLTSLQSGQQISTYLRANAVINKLKRYMKDQPLPIDEITPMFLDKFSNYLKVEYKNRTNTIHGNLRIIRKIMNDAVRDGIIKYEDNPFLKMTLKEEKTTRSFLLEKEVDSLASLDLHDKPLLANARDAFVFACYAGGIRISDLLQLRWRNIENGHLLIKMQKTGGIQSVKLVDKAMKILEHFHREDSQPTDFVFPYITSDEEINTPVKLHYVIGRKTALINKYLGELAVKAEIDKKITCHVARHTFATIALRKGIPIVYVSKLLGHANLKETQVYAKIVNEDLDKAMEVFNN